MCSQGIYMSSGHASPKHVYCVCLACDTRECVHRILVILVYHQGMCCPALGQPKNVSVSPCMCHQGLFSQVRAWPQLYLTPPPLVTRHGEPGPVRQ